MYRWASRRLSTDEQKRTTYHKDIPLTEESACKCKADPSVGSCHDNYAHVVVTGDRLLRYYSKRASISYGPGTVTPRW